MKYEFIHRRIHDWNCEEKAIINRAIRLILEIEPAQYIRHYPG